MMHAFGEGFMWTLGGLTCLFVVVCVVAVSLWMIHKNN